MPNRLFNPHQPIFDQCREWLAYPQHQSRLEESQKLLQEYLVAPGRLNPKTLFRLEWLEHHSGMAACGAYGRHDFPVLAQHLSTSVRCRALVLRLDAAFSAMTPDDAGGRPAAFNYSMRAAAPAMLGWWEEAKCCAQELIEIAEKDQRLRILESRRLRHGTVDAFLIGLFSKAFDINTVFQSLTPLCPAYAALLVHWNSPHASDFIPAMQDAAEFHVSRSREFTDEVQYEFDDYFTRVFPVELLTVQALRMRDRLPYIETGHPLVDDAWSTIAHLPVAPADPLLQAVETRLKNDYPLFR